MDFDRSKDEYIMLDWAGRGRFTHYPSGDTCLRHEWMIGIDGDAKWNAKLEAFLEKHQSTKVIVSSQYNVIDTTDSLQPWKRLPFAVGDSVVVRNREGAIWSQEVVAIERQGELANYTLDDGAEVSWDAYSYGWFAYSCEPVTDRMRVRKPIAGEVVPTYDEAFGSIRLGM